LALDLNFKESVTESAAMEREEMKKDMQNKKLDVGYTYIVYAFSYSILKLQAQSSKSQQLQQLIKLIILFGTLKFC
jgi:hypothetical protein